MVTPSARAASAASAAFITARDIRLISASQGRGAAQGSGSKYSTSRGAV
jgi:hypothetical protein